ncbi:MAG: type I restriction enzyme HsdR N-terminal domain-containing protein [Clostridia bacterium]|nr:type I restriction enzyme HsdR N-terminal domain-containing protein [Clostridia bacterium]
MVNKISRMKLPPIYKRNGKECYLDPIRKKLIYITPEETIRQRVVAYLMQVLKVPADMLIVESHLAHYKLDSRRRADIVIHTINEEGKLYPIAIVECKAPGVGLDDSVGNQLCDYCDSLGANYAMMVNDVECFSFHYEEKKNQYVQIDQLPNYKDMLDGKFEVRKLGDLPERITYNEIPQFMANNAAEVGVDISPKTPRNLAYAAFNLWEGLLDTRHKMSAKQYSLFTLIEDYGIRQLSYGNAGGGVFYGLYRSFIIDYKGSTEIVSIGFSPYSPFANPDVEKTAMVVAIDNDDNSHHALQFSIDDNLVQKGDTYIFYHHGRIAIGNKGSGKVGELIAFASERYPKIIDGKKFNLGVLEYTKDWNLDDSDVEKLIENIITYSLIRDEFRTVAKKTK